MIESIEVFEVELKKILSIAVAASIVLGMTACKQMKS